MDFGCFLTTIHGKLLQSQSGTMNGPPKTLQTLSEGRDLRKIRLTT